MPSNQPTDDRLIDLEIKLSYQEQTMQTLSQALVEKEARITALEESVSQIESALRILAQRQKGGDVEVAGKMDLDDPVPRSG